MIDRPLTGEPLPLDLVNTRWAAEGQVRDLFDEPGALGEWLAEHDLAPAAAEDALAPLRTVRAAIRRFLEDGADDELNLVLEHGRLRLEVSDGVPGERAEVDRDDWLPAWEVARSFLELLRSAPRGRLRRCEGPECVLWFLDTSRNGRRRWCSMAGCGNRAKVKSHYDRARGR
ncbi:CGNR zinc finger domain-containing protein [Saccharopolyspora taberi]|uniref:CGNR zinc finger domain-containing protein n=1 Tax=Saccharopolyspora taberi TaxID=60895 RepID=A0ABN3VEA3_9PSEU